MTYGWTDQVYIGIKAMPDDEVLAFEESMQASYIKQLNLLSRFTNERNINDYLDYRAEQDAQALEVEEYLNRNFLTGFC